jgi:hypothetical protein
MLHVLQHGHQEVGEVEAVRCVSSERRVACQSPLSASQAVYTWSII